MFRKTIVGTLTFAFALTASVAFGETNRQNASTTRPLQRLENRVEKRIENRENGTSTRFSSTTRPLLRDRVDANASTTKMVDSTCAKAAVDVRKTSLVSIYGTFTTTLNTSLSTRENAVKASFDQTTKKARQEARTAARLAYKKSVKAAFETLRTSEKSTMRTYASSIKACGGTNSEASDESSDGSIADSILK